VSTSNDPLDAFEVAQQVAAALEEAGIEYALGGAIALGYWAEPRGTLDVDITLFMSPDQPSACVRLLQRIGCDVKADLATRSLTEHSFCQVDYRGRRLDVFLPMSPFYEQARLRRKFVALGNQTVNVWDAETLCVFKMMFFRRKDFADIEQILRQQGEEFDRNWVRDQLIEIYGPRDPRISEWDALTQE
jgi:hypothetical protein